MPRRSGSTVLPALLLLCACSAVTSTDGGNATDPETTGEAPSGPFLDGFFPIGVFSQPTSMFEVWRERGCNTMLEVPQGEDRLAWDEGAQEIGFKIIRRPVSDPADDVGRTDLLAWSLPDEPDVQGNNEPCGGNCIELCESLYERWHAVDPTRPIFVNLAGPNVLLPASCDYCNGPGDEPPSSECFPESDQCYPRLLEATDWVSQDIYPVSGWLFTEEIRGDITIVGQSLDKLRGWADKPLFAIVETSDQRLDFPGAGSRGPTPAEYRAEVWDAIIHGARGIFYFPQAFNPFVWDATQQPVLDEMQRQHETIAELASVLQGQIDPPGITATVPAPLETGWRRDEEHTYVLVLNTSGTAVPTATITLDGLASAPAIAVHGESRSLTLADGAFVDEFEPHALHIYVVPNR